MRIFFRHDFTAYISSSGGFSSNGQFYIWLQAREKVILFQNGVSMVVRKKLNIVWAQFVCCSNDVQTMSWGVSVTKSQLLDWACHIIQPFTMHINSLIFFRDFVTDIQKCVNFFYTNTTRQNKPQPNHTIWLRQIEKLHEYITMPW